MTSEAQDAIDGIETALRTSLASRILAKGHHEAIGPYEQPRLHGDERDVQRLFDGYARHTHAVDYQRVQTIKALDDAINPLVDELDATVRYIARLRTSEAAARQEARQWRRIAFAWVTVAFAMLVWLP